MAFMGAAELRKGKFGLFLDAVYADLSADGTWFRTASSTGPRRSSASHPRLLLPVYDDPEVFVDLYAGAASSTSTSSSRSAPQSRRAPATELDLGRRDHRGPRRRGARRALVGAGFADYGGFDGAATRAGNLWRRQLRLQRALGRPLSATATSRSSRRSPTRRRSTSTSRARSSASPTSSEPRLEDHHRHRLHPRGGPRLPRPARRQADAGPAHGRPRRAHGGEPQAMEPAEMLDLAPRQPQGLRADVRRLLPHGRPQGRVTAAWSWPGPSR